MKYLLCVWDRILLLLLWRREDRRRKRENVVVKGRYVRRVFLVLCGSDIIVKRNDFFCE